MAALDPELDVAVAALVAEDARFVIVGGFAVIANRYVRATEDIDILIPCRSSRFADWMTESSTSLHNVDYRAE